MQRTVANVTMDRPGSENSVCEELRASRPADGRVASPIMLPTGRTYSLQRLRRALPLRRNSVKIRVVADIRIRQALYECAFYWKLTPTIKLVATSLVCETPEN